jgi:hypothetical protein
MSRLKSASAEMPSSSEPTLKARAAGKCGKNSKPSPKKTVSDPAEAARKRLGVTPEQMEGVPRVTERVVIGAGSLRAVIAVLRGDDSEASKKFMAVYDSLLEKDRYKLSLEEIFTVAGLTAREFVEAVSGALFQQAQDISNMMIAVAMPKVAKTLVQQATKRKPDLKAVEIFGKISKMLPTPKGAQTVINVQQLNQQIEEAEQAGELEPMDDFLMELQQVKRPALPAPKTVEIPVNTADLEYKYSEV